MSDPPWTVPADPSKYLGFSSIKLVGTDELARLRAELDRASRECAATAQAGAEVAAELDALRAASVAVLESLPCCETDGCFLAATYTDDINTDIECDDHARTPCTPLPYRVQVAALAALVGR